MIYYFTALIGGSHRARQLTYLRALRTLPTVEMIFGRYKLKSVQCGVPGCDYPGDRRFKVPEEKRTDVNIGIHMVRDPLQDNCDRLIVVSGDADLVPAVNMVKAHAPGKEVLVYVPARNQQRGAAVELRGAADRGRILPNQLIKHAQFPAEIPDADGDPIRKPERW